VNAAAARALCAAVGAHILGREAPALGVADWAAFTALAQENKLFLHAVAGLGEAAPAPVAAAAARYRALTLQMNGANLAGVRAIMAALGQAGVGATVIKGPLAQNALYGDYFARPSSDIDLLVAPGDFRAARAVLASAGYRRAAPCASPWWRVFLGEEHFLAPAPGGVSIDLHHKVQQPGAPAPKRADLLRGASETIALGAQPIRILAPPAALLLACMSLVKGMVHREPSGAYAADIAAHIARGGALPDAFALARAMRLRRTLQAGLRAAESLFGVAAPGAGSFAVGAAEDLAALILAPAHAPRRPRRTQILWALADDPAAFAREFAWKVSAEAARAPLAALTRHED
jgi:hypothetical protein